MERPSNEHAFAIAIKLQAAIHGVGQTHGEVEDQRHDAHDAAGLHVVVAQPAKKDLPQDLVLQGLMVLMQRLVVCHDPMHAALALLGEDDRPLLLRVILGEVVGMNVRRRLERRLVEARILVADGDASAGQALAFAHVAFQGGHVIPSGALEEHPRPHLGPKLAAARTAAARGLFAHHQAAGAVRGHAVDKEITVARERAIAAFHEEGTIEGIVAAHGPREFPHPPHTVAIAAPHELQTFGGRAGFRL